MSLDPTSFGNVAQVRQKHLHLELNVNFETSRLEGFIDITVEALQDADQLVLDSSALTVTKAESLDDQTQLEFSLDAKHAAFGSALRIQRTFKQGQTSKIRVHYQTSPEATAIQWLPPSQTADKQFPYLFTQCQAIHARSLLPCQDGCVAKATYSARITVPEGLVALMSAARTGSEGNVFNFEQKVPIPTYLIAMAVGKLVSRDVGPRSKVWSEESQVDAAAWEFAETEKYLKTAEDLLGPYVWGTYDILMLPPSFPYGGMENPQLTFVTPTLIAGDRSLADVIVHEIVHSWCGNLVTNLNWEHFWLNEGFTQYNERKILGRLSSEPERQLHFLLGLNALQIAVDRFGRENPHTNLVITLDGIDPDDTFSSIPYEKGSFFLFFLEQIVGTSDFEVFMRQWIHDHQYLTVTSDDFKSYFLKHFASKGAALDAINWDAWFYTPGMPLVTNKYDTTLAEVYQSLAVAWTEKTAAIEQSKVDGFTVLQLCGLLEEIIKTEHIFTADEMDQLTSLKAFQTKNAEIIFLLCKLGIKCRYEKILPEVVRFITSQGRMKYVRPLYRALFSSDFGKELAVATFSKHRSGYHPVCATMLGKDLEIEQS